MIFSRKISALLVVGAALATAVMPGEVNAQQRSPLAQIGDVLQPSSVTLPAEADLVRLVDETMDIFVEGMKAKTMQGLLDHASVVVKKEITAARLDEIFKAFFAVPVTGKPLQGLAPVFSTGPERLSATAFKLTGFYPTQPQNVAFDITYIREGLGWRWVAINVRTQAAGQQPARPAS